jgi:hypothetical protein
MAPATETELPPIPFKRKVGYAAGLLAAVICYVAAWRVEGSA